MASTRTIASTAVFTAFVAAATMAFSVSVPITSGYFNVGEIMVYTAAMLMGPYVGAFAGGVGSAMSDVALGFPAYAPGTLIIKGIEGFIVGYLTSRALTGLPKSAWKATSVALGGTLGALVALLGVQYLSGDHQLSLGFPIGPQATIDFNIPSLFWVGLGVATFALILVVGLTVDDRLGWTTLFVLIGGAEMVLGYFLYESFVLGLGFASASGEVPVNVIQALVGLLVSVPLVASIKRILSRAPIVRT